MNYLDKTNLLKGIQGTTNLLSKVFEVDIKDIISSEDWKDIYKEIKR